MEKSTAFKIIKLRNLATLDEKYVSLLVLRCNMREYHRKIARGQAAGSRMDSS